MKSLYKAPLALAIAASTLASAPAAFAANEPSLNINLRTLYFNRDFHDGAEDRYAGSQAVRVDYVSPYYNGMIGFDASLFGALKLDGGKEDEKIGMLHDDNGNTDSYAKLGQAYLKLKLGENTELRAGRMVLETALLYDDDSRSTPSSTQAIKLDTKLGGADLYAIYSDRAVNMAGTKFNEYKAGGEDYDLYIVGGGYTFENGLSIQAAHGVADDYLRQTYLNASYPIKLANGDSMLIDAHYYDGSDDGSLYGSDYASDLFNLAGRYTTGDLTMTLSYQKTGDEYYDYSWDGFNNDNHILMTWNSVQYSDFNNADEQSLQVRADYTVAAVPGLSLMARHTEGWDIDSGTDTDLEERETNLEAKYVFQGGTFEGLSLRARVAHVESEIDNEVDEFRLIANYGFSAL
ncbi:imipenem/basic amino acid-specific outer membrane pore [Marinobacterium halophilum]|uniref:Imipenem/basic amino acid-specific outer membrane pore n=1 Tax=Marinobacterium halophilum TaxID=267374 RepID=A0A2P8EUX4_9GAMM|nr:OprD family outer membrane porin [Marinobacterium halophilum]PSL13277.1 imipenem/basic amino acid-specific outer membrane pore [Marinobacterium halophilum]